MNYNINVTIDVKLDPETQARLEREYIEKILKEEKFEEILTDNEITKILKQVFKEVK